MADKYIPTRIEEMGLNVELDEQFGTNGYCEHCGTSDFGYSILICPKCYKKFREKEKLADLLIKHLEEFGNPQKSKVSWGNVVECWQEMDEEWKQILKEEYINKLEQEEKA